MSEGSHPHTVDLLFMRYKAATPNVGEARRVVHMVIWEWPETVPDQVQALCGEALRQGTVEPVNPFGGMPCSGCMVVVGLLRLPASEILAHDGFQLRLEPAPLPALPGV